MNSSPFSRRLLFSSGARSWDCNPAPTIEPLEARIAPATLVNPTTVTFQDKNGDAVTVTISKPLFTAASVAKVFTFDTGSVNGSNTALQQLETLNITALGAAASGMNISITAKPINSSPGIVNVGYINSSDIDLGTVTIGGDLGRIAAGDLTFKSPAIQSLTVDSLGAQGTATQAAGGNLDSLFSGSVGAITVNGNIDNASIGIGGGVHGTLGPLLVTGSILGGAADFSGSIRTQGGITSVQVDGSITGGAGSTSGVIGTAGTIGSVLVEGSVGGGGGSFSGAILASGAIQSAHITGNLTGGAGDDSGQIGTASTMGPVIIGGSVQGGKGTSSGAVLSTGNMTSVTISAGLIGGAGADSGQVGSGANIGPVTITGSTVGIQGGAGPSSGTVVAAGAIGNVTIGGNIAGYLTATAGVKPAIDPGAGSGAISAGGAIQSVQVNGSVNFGGILSGASIGNVVITGSLTNGSEIHASQNIALVSVNVVNPGSAPAGGAGFGIVNSSILTDSGSIGSIIAGCKGTAVEAIEGASIAAGANIGSIAAYDSSPLNSGSFAILNSEFVALGGMGNITVHSNCSVAIADSHFQAANGIGDIAATAFDEAILSSTFRAGAGIAGITMVSTVSGVAAVYAGFDAGGSVGAVNATGLLEGSVFVAGIDLGPAFAVAGAGTFNNATAAGLGFGSSTSAVAAHIGKITVNKGSIDNCTFLAGVHGAGLDKVFGTTDDSVATGSSIGAISATGGLNVVFMESGSIGATMSSGIEGVTYLATDTAVSSAGIGAITVVATIQSSASAAGYGIANSTFTSNAGIGDIKVSLSGIRESGTNAGIGYSTFEAGHALGTITVIDSATGTAGHNYGIARSKFNGGLSGFGGTGDINVTLTDTAADGSSAAIGYSDFDASAGAGVTASMGSISAENADTSASSVGIIDSAFRAHGNLGNISSTMDSGSATAPGIEGSVFSAFGSIGAINVYGAVIADATGASRFLAGYDIGSGMTFGNQDLSTGSIALQASQSVGNVDVTGYFSGSDITASVNPGTGYLFGSANASNVGVGGSIGLVNLGSNVSLDSTPFKADYATSNAIEAATFALGKGATTPTVSAFGYTSTLPIVLYVDGGPGDVRIREV